MPASSSARALIAALGHRLREIREDAGLSQRDMATTLGWHSSKLSKIEHGKQTPHHHHRHHRLVHRLPHT